MLDTSLIATALANAFEFSALLAVFGGVFTGYVVGVIPGLNRSVAIAVAIPLTFYMPALAAISFLIGLSKGTAAGSAVSAILLNTPGEPASAATCADGYPLARSGKPRLALQVGLWSSVIGDFLSTVLLIAVALPFARVALEFGPYELAAILLFSLVFISGMTSGSLMKGLAAAGLGIVVGSVGLDLESGAQRLTFGAAQLMDGVPLIAVAIGTLALSEMFMQIEKVQSVPQAERIKLGDAVADRMSFAVFVRCLPTILRGTAIGAFVGFLPGLGASVASFLSYSLTQKLSKTPEKYGHGMPQGIAASEAADNAVVPASFIPLFGLGIPGSVAAALLVGAFAMQGITPGPLLLRQEPELLISIFAGMMAASLMMLVIGLFGLRIFARITVIPDRVVVPMVIFLCLSGAWLQGYGSFGLWMVLAFAGLGFLMKKFDFSFVTFIVAFIVTPLLELNLRQSIILSRGDPSVLLERPIALVFLALTALGLWQLGRSSRAGKNPPPPPADAASQTTS